MALVFSENGFRFSLRGDEYFLVSKMAHKALLAEGYEPENRHAAAMALRDYVTQEPLIARDRFYRLCQSGCLSVLPFERLSTHQVVERVVKRLGDPGHGEYLVLHRPRRELYVQRLTPLEEAEPEPAPSGNVWVEFRVELADRTPYKGAEYVLIDPKKNRQEGTLNDEGRVYESNARPGQYELALKAVEDVTWQTKRVKCGEPVEVSARTAGYADGTPAKIHIYRALCETEDDCLDTLDASVESDAIKAEWQLDEGSIERAQEATGVWQLIAEVDIDNGKCWGKTQTPLAVELKSIVSAQWAANQALLGEPVGLLIETAGFADGTAVGIEVFGHRWGQDEPESLAELSEGVVQSGKCEVTWTSEAPRNDEAAAAGMACHFVVTIDDGVQRSATSLPLWLDARETDPQG